MQSIRQNDQQRPRGAWVTFAVALWLALLSAGSYAQQAVEPAPAELFDANELDGLVAPLALYPDDLLAIMLPASTYPLQVVEAARFLEDREQDPALEPDEQWDDAIIALLNYPEALQLLNDDLDWTWQLGEAVLAQQADVLEAIEVFRDRAYLAGNLESDDYQRVERSDDGIRIVPADPEVIYVPYYDPVRVTVRYPYRAYYYHDHAYPLYYYPYDIGHRFYGSLFWGVSTAFSISWHNRYVHLYHYDHYRHPYYGRRYHTDRYYRHRRSIDYHIYAGGVRQRHRGNYYRWYPGRHHGARPRYNRYRADANRRVLSYDNQPRRQLTRSAERARSVNQTRQRYRTFDNVIDRDRSRRSDNRVTGAQSRQRGATVDNNRRATPNDRANRLARSDRATNDRTSRFRSSDANRRATGTRTQRDATTITRRSNDARSQRQSANANPRSRDASTDRSSRSSRFSRSAPVTRTTRPNAAPRGATRSDRVERRAITPRAAPQRNATQRNARQRAPAAASRPAPQRYQRSERRSSERPRASGGERRSSRQANRSSSKMSRGSAGRSKSRSSGSRRERK